MSSLARRGVRTTATVAGIAALGTGFAGAAMAMPLLPVAPADPGIDAFEAPAAPSTDALADLTATPTADGMPELPDLFTFEVPSINGSGMRTADIPPLPSMPEAPAAPESPGSFDAPGADSFVPEMNAGPDGGLPEIPEFQMPEIEMGEPSAPNPGDFSEASDTFQTEFGSGMDRGAQSLDNPLG
jgi:hypothetical protein